MPQPPPDGGHATPEHREDAIPAALATPLLQYLSTLALPPDLRPDAMTPEARRDKMSPRADSRVPNTKALRTLVDQLLQDRAVLDALQHVLDTARMGNPSEQSGAARGTEGCTAPHAVQRYPVLDALVPTDAGVTLLDTYAQVLTPVLAKLLAAHLDAVAGQAALPQHTAPSRVLPLPLEAYLYVLSAAHYQAVREVLAYGAFAQVEGSPWPTARLVQPGGKKNPFHVRPYWHIIAPYA